MNGTLIRPEDRQLPCSTAEALAILSKRSPANAILLQACRDKVSRSTLAPRETEHEPVPSWVAP